LPQPPQFELSVLVLTHWPLHSASPVGQLQAPVVHVVPPVQVTLHAPQLFESVCSLTHDPPQFVVGAVHEAPQTPALQVCVDEQTVPHVPQLFGSVCVVTHTPPQERVPDGHKHEPPTQA
jgi:hypothetical protein